VVFRSASVGLVREGQSSVSRSGRFQVVFTSSFVLLRRHHNGIEVQVHLHAVSLGVEELFFKNGLVLVVGKHELEVASFTVREMLLSLILIKLNGVTH